MTRSMAAAAPFVCADHTMAPATVTVSGSLQSELGCSGDWQPDCADTHLTFDAEDDVWQGTFSVPAGSWQYKVALDDSWTENYGANATQDGAQISLDLTSTTDVKFYYDHETHWVADSQGAVIAVAAGSFQSEMGCSGDWQPWCLRSWLQNPDGNGIYSFVTGQLPAGSYETKVAHNEDWTENYGQGGVSGGANVSFTVPGTCDDILFEYNLASHILSIGANPDPAQPGSIAVTGNFQSELGCPGDWQPDCAATHLSYDAEDGVWQGTFNIPAGNWQYNAALNDSWTESYGANATRDGALISLNLASTTDVKFYYDHGTHWVVDNQNAAIIVAAGSFQSELGCSGDWQPWCLRSWLQDPDGNGIYSFFTDDLAAGSYETKVAHDEDWTENYGAGGAANGTQIPFTVSASCQDVFFTNDLATHITNVTVGSETDTDDDGFGVSADCDDTDPAVNPDADEVCEDGIDNDCDGDIDDADSDCVTDGGGSAFLNCGTLSSSGGPGWPGALEFALLVLMLAAVRALWSPLGTRPAPKEPKYN